MHNPVIYKEIGINIIFPTTSVCDHSSFPKEEIQDRIDFLVPQMEILLFDSFFIRKKQTGNNLFFRIDPKTHTSSHASTSHIPAPPHTSPHTSSHATPHIPRTSSHITSHIFTRHPIHSPHRLTHHLTHLHTPPHTFPAPPHASPHTSSHATPHIPRASSHCSTPPARSPGLLFSPSSERPQRSVKKGRLFERSEFLPFSVVQEASRRKK